MRKKNNLRKLSIILFLIIIVLAIGIFILGGKLPTAQEITVINSGGHGILASECFDKDYISSIADYIIEGTVSKVESKWEGGRIFTYSTISISSYVKGVLPIPCTRDVVRGKCINQDETFTIKTGGGCVLEICEAVEDQPVLHEGKIIRAYIKQSGNEFSIVCGIAGIEEL